MSVIDELRDHIAKKRIIFDRPDLEDELLGSDVTAELQALVSHLASLEKLRISSIVRNEGHHGRGRAFDIGNEEIAKSLLPQIATDAEVAKWSIDELIFDAKKADSSFDRNKWNYDLGAKHAYPASTLDAHGDHIHFAVAAMPVEARIRRRRSDNIVKSYGWQEATANSIAAGRRAAASLVLIDFRSYPDDHRMPQQFAIAGYGFESLAGGRLMVNDTASDRGLQFDATGLRIALRRPVDSLVITAGGFAGAVTVKALDPFGSLIQQRQVLPPDRLVRFVLNAPNVSSLELTGGGNEGLLVELIVPEC